MRAKHWFYTLPLRLRSLFRRDRVEQDLSEELQFHLEQKTQEFVGGALAQTRRAAKHGANLAASNNPRKTAATRAASATYKIWRKTCASVFACFGRVRVSRL